MSYVNVILSYGVDNEYGDFWEGSEAVALPLEKGDTQLCDDTDELEDTDSEDEELEVGEFDENDDDDFYTDGDDDEE
jgi:hypothetical protein